MFFIKKTESILGKKSSPKQFMGEDLLTFLINLSNI